MSLMTDHETAEMESQAIRTDLIAYIGWERYGYFELPDRARKTYKIHVGRITGQFGHRNMTITPLCHYHAGHISFTSRNSEVFEHRVDPGRICSKCAERYPGFWHRLQSIPPQPKQYYILVTLEEGDQQSTVRIKKNFEDVKLALKNKPEFIAALEKREKDFQKVDLLYAKPGFYLFKGTPVSVKAKMKTLVEDVEEVKED